MTSPPGPAPSPDDPATLLRGEREALLARTRELGRHMDAFFEASRDSNADDEHDPEGQTIAFERAQLSAVTAQAHAHLAEVDAALARLADGSYGTCEVCGEPVDPRRLQVRPTARTCVQHATGSRRAP